MTILAKRLAPIKMSNFLTSKNIFQSSQFLFVFFFWLLIYSLPSQARPEYAARHRITRCTACHISPSGGSLRNIYGKAYGARNFSLNKYGQQDLVSIDARSLYYMPQKAAQQKGGLFLMGGFVGANVPLYQDPSSQKEWRVVHSYNFVAPGAAPWESYVRYQLHDEKQATGFLQYVSFGRIHLPFGLMTDEHRTYTRIQTASKWNTDLEGALLLSGEFLESLHYDAGIISGQTSKATLATGESTHLGWVFNMRWTSPYSMPIVLGGSAKSYDTDNREKNPWARSLYAIYSFDRGSFGFLKGSLMAEYARARYLNSNASAELGEDTTYQNTVVDDESEGLLLQANIYLNENFIFQLKYDQLSFNKDYHDDAFTRRGVGIKAILGPNILASLRHEWAKAGPVAEKNGNGKGAIGATFFLLQVSI